jgi:hypothetical protein
LALRQKAYKAIIHNPSQRREDNSKSDGIKGFPLVATVDSKKALFLWNDSDGCPRYVLGGDSGEILGWQRCATLHYQAVGQPDGDGGPDGDVLSDGNWCRTTQLSAARQHNVHRSRHNERPQRRAIHNSGEQFGEQRDDDCSHSHGQSCSRVLSSRAREGQRFEFELRDVNLGTGITLI